jgi:DNA/RNA-binding domain of Phe-tRNA-synthetase-like protein
VLKISQPWKVAYPGALVGLLAASGVANPGFHPGLQRAKEALEEDLRSRYSSREELTALEVIQAYARYFKSFKKTYHVLLQVESIALKGNSLPRVAALVEAMFMAEIKNLLLTAGHDLEAVEMPLGLDIAQVGEEYTLLNGREQSLKPGDMMIADGQGIISSVVYGPDRRTRISPDTRKVLFVVYAPPGISREAVEKHLDDLEANVRLVSPQAEVDYRNIVGTK